MGVGGEERGMTKSVYLDGGRIHVLMASGYYIGQIRDIGHRKFKTVTERCKSMEGALSKAAAKAKAWHRIRVLLIDSNPYYGPTQVFDGKCVSWGLE